jgi:hypothetical protein
MSDPEFMSNLPPWITTVAAAGGWLWQYISGRKDRGVTDAAKAAQTQEYKTDASSSSSYQAQIDQLGHMVEKLQESHQNLWQASQASQRKIGWLTGRILQLSLVMTQHSIAIPDPTEPEPKD